MGGMNNQEPVSSIDSLCEDYYRIEQAIRYLEAHYRQQPSLAEIASAIGLSEYHFQRLFTHWAGISPKRFLQYLTKEHAKRLLDQSASLLETAYQSGLSGPGRLHDLFVTSEAVTPGEYKARGAGLEIRYGFHPSPFGECLLAMTERGICDLAFVDQGARPPALSELQSFWRQASFYEDPASTRPLVDQIFVGKLGIGRLVDWEFVGSHQSTNLPTYQYTDLPLFLKATNFQLKVWEALLRIPAGQVVAYEDLAQMIEAPRAARAVGSAVASNPIPLLIPCHRVIRKAGEFGNYRYGSARKKAMLGWEMAQCQV
jgi:AraC family transcriptional regulator of adaptative response/methylated-DNA-[protein]-cysteine methyltransferase